MIIKLQGSMRAISEILLVCFFRSELIVTDLYPLGHPFHSKTASTQGKLLHSLPIDIII